MALYRINSLAIKHADKGIKAGGIRWQVFNEHNNGLSESGAVVRNGRAVYIDEDRYFEWLRAGGKRSVA